MIWVQFLSAIISSVCSDFQEWLEKIFCDKKERNHQQGMVQRHNCIKSGFKREERFQHGSKLKVALLDRTYFIKKSLKHQHLVDSIHKKLQVFTKISGIMSIQNGKLFFDQNPLLSNGKHSSDTMVNIEKRKKKKEQKLEIKLKL